MKTMRLQQICRELSAEIYRLSGDGGGVVVGLPIKQFEALHVAAALDMECKPTDWHLEICGVKFVPQADKPKSPHQWPRAFDIEADGKIEHVDLDKESEQRTFEIAARLLKERDAEREEVQKLDKALRDKDAAMGVLFERMKAAGVDYSDLIS